MPDPTDGLSKFSFGFTVPDDYAPGTPMQLRVIWRSNAISCVVDLRNNSLQWAQPGALNDNGALVKGYQVMLAHRMMHDGPTRPTSY